MHSAVRHVSSLSHQSGHAHISTHSTNAPTTNPSAHASHFATQSGSEEGVTTEGYWDDRPDQVRVRPILVLDSRGMDCFQQGFLPSRRRMETNMW